MKIDMTVMPSGKRYEDTYGLYLDILKEVAESERVVVVNPPFCWIPLLHYFDAEVIGGQEFFEQDKWFDFCGIMDFKNRHLIEVLSTVRPELVDALWKSDMQWKIKFVLLKKKKEFFVTNNGSFHRPEVNSYIEELWKFVPEKKNVVLVPCAADKPYPSPLHKKVLSMMPEDFYLANVTGVLGVVPQDLWRLMPHYDSGIPNEWRLFQIARKYFSKFEHDKIVCYLDYYSVPLYHVFSSLKQLNNVVFVNDIKFYADYLDLLDEKLLCRLENSFNDNNFKSSCLNAVSEYFL